MARVESFTSSCIQISLGQEAKPLERPPFGAPEKGKRGFERPRRAGAARPAAREKGGAVKRPFGGHVLPLYAMIIHVFLPFHMIFI